MFLFTSDTDENPYTLIVGSEDEFQTSRQLMEHAGLEEKILGRVAITENEPGTDWLLEKDK